MSSQKSVCFSIFAITAIVLTLCGCPQDSKEIQEFEKKKENVNALMEKQPAPNLDFSMDRYLLSERLVRLNNPNKMTFLYMFFPNGDMLSMTIVGKLSSTSKRLTVPEQINVMKDPEYDIFHRDNCTAYEKYTGSSPDEMGTYGLSDPAKVGITTIGSLIEAGGFMAYIYSEQPLVFKNLTKPPIEFEVEATADERAVLSAKLEELRSNMK